MVKRLIFFLGCLLAVNFSFGQKVTLIVEGTTPDLYLLHLVKPKQNFYSIGRLYNISAKEISTYNHLQFENGLAIGQTIKIPLTAENFSQAENDRSSESLIPVYHIVQPKEGLYRISIKYNKVPMTTIKKWNNLASDNVNVGAQLIIGYLKVNPAESSLGRKNPDDEMTTSQSTAFTNEPQQVTKDTKANLPVKTTIENDQTSTESSNTSIRTDQPEGPGETSTRIRPANNFGFSGGYFKKLYNDQVAQKPMFTEPGNAGVFKSTSGWQDGRYYCFSNDVPAGTVIKVTYNTTGKSVYAKVLDAIPDIKQNDGLNIIVSNAAAQELGAGEKFDCALTFVR